MKTAHVERRGPANPRGKNKPLPDEDREEIRAMIAAGKSVLVVSKATGWSVGTVRRVARAAGLARPVGRPRI
ncbi:MAG: hypothetical protein ABW022_08625 [Actinoplanes sp.]